MRTFRALVRKNRWTSVTLLVLTLWVSGVSSLITSSTSSDQVSSAHCPSDEESEQVVLSSLEAIVTPVAKIQLAYFSTLLQELTLVEAVIERVAVDVPLPRSSYLRTLFRLIISPNAP